MEIPSFESKLEKARNIPDIFELVKLAVRKTIGKERSGLMLGLSNLGGGPEGFVGAYYPVATNIIVMNTMPLDRIRQTDPSLYKPYVFHILLHEYIHTLGVMTKATGRRRARSAPGSSASGILQPSWLRTCPSTCQSWSILCTVGSPKANRHCSWSKGSIVPPRTCTLIDPQMIIPHCHTKVI
jgi:hypothetical protein